MAVTVEYGGKASLDVRSKVTHPRYGSQLTGYKGHIPGMKYASGGNFSTLSHCLAIMNQDIPHPPIGFKEKEEEEDEVDDHVEDFYTTLQEIKKKRKEGCADKKYDLDIPSGYAGFIPRFKLNSLSRTFHKGLENSIKNNSEINEKIKNNLKNNSDCGHDPMVSVVCPPQIHKNITSLINYYHPCSFSSKKEKMQPPKSKYSGHVPRSYLMETVGKNYENQSCIALSTFNCYQDYYEDRLKNPRIEMPVTYRERFIAPIICEKESKIFRIYHKEGMNPRYTGWVPGVRNCSGKSYSGCTRLMECCKHDEDSYGHYIDKKPVKSKTKAIVIS